MYNTIVIHAALAFFGTISLIVLLRNTARRMSLVDHPSGRKQHEGAVPVVGGIAIFVSTIVSVSIAFVTKVTVTAVTT